MRLHIHPYSVWVGYDITRPDVIQSLLPPHLSLASIPILARDRHYKPKLLFNSYDLSSTWMTGHRLEIQTVARDRRLNTVHLVVLECFSDATLWNPIDGVRPPNARCALRLAPARRPRDLSLSVQSACRVGLTLNGTIDKATRISSSFAVDANRRCYFGTHPQPYPLSFDEREVLAPVSLFSSLRIRNNLWANVRTSSPSHSFVHTSPMHFDVAVKELWYDA